MALLLLVFGSKFSENQHFQNSTAGEVAKSLGEIHTPTGETRSNVAFCLFLSSDLAFRRIRYEHFAFAGYCLTYLALYYLKRASDPETALKYLKEGETYIQNGPVDFLRIQLFRNIALCLVEKKQYKKAIRTLKKSCGIGLIFQKYSKNVSNKVLLNRNKLKPPIILQNRLSKL